MTTFDKIVKIYFTNDGINSSEAVVLHDVAKITFEGGFAIFKDGDGDFMVIPSHRIKEIDTLKK